MKLRIGLIAVLAAGLGVAQAGGEHRDQTNA